MRDNKLKSIYCFIETVSEERKRLEKYLKLIKEEGVKR